MYRKELERVSPESVGISSKSILRFLDRLESGFTEMHGLMILRHGKVCAEGWWSPYAPGIRHGLQSHTKTYAATAIGIAYTEGLLSLEDKILDLFPEEAPEAPGENLKKLRVRDVLCMGCGMETMPRQTEHWIRDFLATPVIHEPGTRFLYNSVGSSLLCAILHRLTGQSMLEYLTPRLFDKIGIDVSNLRCIRMPDGIEMGGGGLFATTEDNLRLMKLYADGGVWEGERILREDFVRQAVSCQNDSSTEALVNPPATDNFLGYGFQIWMCKPRDVYRADGAMGQFTIVFPHHDMLIAINETASGAHWAQQTLDTVWEFLEEVASEGPLPEDPDSLAALRRRTASLCLPNPAFHPHSPLLPQVDGRTYLLSQKSVSSAGPFLPQLVDGKRTESFRLDFQPGVCRCSLRGAGPEEQELLIATDGSRRLNLVESGTPASMALLSGAWLTPAVFEIRVRWVETCFEMAIALEFDEDGGRVEIHTKNTVGSFPPSPDGPAGDGPSAVGIRAQRENNL